MTSRALEPGNRFESGLFARALVRGKLRGHRCKRCSDIIEPKGGDRLKASNPTEHTNVLFFGHPSIGVGDKSATRDNAVHEVRILSPINFMIEILPGLLRETA